MKENYSIARRERAWESKDTSRILYSCFARILRCISFAQQERKVYIFLLLVSIGLKAGWAEDTVARMSLRQKIGQSFMMATSSLPGKVQEALASRGVEDKYAISHANIVQAIQEYEVGGIIFLYRNTPESQIACTNHFQKLSTVPLLIGQDCEWGLAMRHQGMVKFPRNMTLAATNDLATIYDVGYHIGKQCKKIGVHINFAPVVDVNSNPHNPVIHDRSFGDRVEDVSQCAIAYMHGIQDAGILACAKHFPGHGDTAVDSHLGLPTILHDRSRLDEIELAPFKTMIATGIDAIMTAHIHIPSLDIREGIPVTLSEKIMTNLLKDEMGFKGLVITDGMGMRGITDCFKDGKAEYEAYKAGVDIILCPVYLKEAIDLIEESAMRGEISLEQIEAKALKILHVKEELGLHKERYIEPCQSSELASDEEALVVKEHAYAQSITVCTKGKMLPIEDASRTMQLSMPEQIDEWEQRANESLDYDTVVIHSMGMNKWAGQHYGISEELIQMIDHFKSLAKHTIVVLYGTPYSIPLVEQADEVIVAYEDDPDARKAVQDLLYGRQEAVGMLPVSFL